jgi:selenocysteine lyase/cysteine desulfurase
LNPSESAAHFERVRSREYRWSNEAVYLNAASWGPLPECARAAVEEFDRKRQVARLTDQDFLDVQDRARQAAARLIAAQPGEIALMPNTSVGLHLAAHFATLQAQDGRRTIVLSDREFPANVYPWLALRERGFRIQFVPATAAGNPDEDALVAALEQDDVVAFSCSFVQFSTGFRCDLARFGRICQERGILFVVDAIQGLGAVPLNVHACRIDVLAAGGQKWLCSPWGTGFAFVRAELASRFEPYLPGWLAFHASRDFTRLVEYDLTYRTDAQRFEVGSQPFQSCTAFASSLELMLELGIENIYQHNRALQDTIIEWACARGDVQVVSDQRARSGILCLRPRNAEAVHAVLLDAGVTCAYREGSIRLSPHFYNDASEVQRLLDTLTRACQR